MRPSRRTFAAGWLTGFGAILIGITATMLGILALEGFRRGLFIGAGVALIILGTVVLAGILGWIGRRGADGERGWWLPSRDHDR